MHLIRILVCTAALYKFQYKIEHIAGIANGASDAFSRMSVAEAMLKYPELCDVIAAPLLPRIDDNDWEHAAVAAWRAAICARKDHQATSMEL
jgi:hypothetical protein